MVRLATGIQTWCQSVLVQVAPIWNRRGGQLFLITLTRPFPDIPPGSVQFTYHGFPFAHAFAIAFPFSAIYSPTHCLHSATLSNTTRYARLGYSDFGSLILGSPSPSLSPSTSNLHIGVYHLHPVHFPLLSRASPSSVISADCNLQRTNALGHVIFQIQHSPLAAFSGQYRFQDPPFSHDHRSQQCIIPLFWRLYTPIQQRLSRLA